MHGSLFFGQVKRWAGGGATFDATPPVSHAAPIPSIRKRSQGESEDANSVEWNGGRRNRNRQRLSGGYLGAMSRPEKDEVYRYNEARE